MTKIEKSNPVLQTANLPAGKTEGMVVDPNLPRLDGPRTGHEFEGRLKADIEAAQAKRAAVGWRKLPSGVSIPADKILATCNLCHRWAWVEPGHETGPCICYHPQASDAGVMRPATPDEEKAWFRRAQEAEKRRIAAEPARKAATDAANRRRNEDDPAAGKHFVNDPTRSRGRG